MPILSAPMTAARISAIFGDIAADKVASEAAAGLALGYKVEAADSAVAAAAFEITDYATLALASLHEMSRFLETEHGIM